MEKCFLLLFDFTGKTTVQKAKEGSTMRYLLGTICEQAGIPTDHAPHLLFLLCLHEESS